MSAPILRVEPSRGNGGAVLAPAPAAADLVLAAPVTAADLAGLPWAVSAGVAVDVECADPELGIDRHDAGSIEAELVAAVWALGSGAGIATTVSAEAAQAASVLPPDGGVVRW